MKIWVDAQISPSIAFWLRSEFNVDAWPVSDVGFRDAQDLEIFQAARSENAVVLTKDRDFIHLLERFGPPPVVIWLTCGNTSNSNLMRILAVTFLEAVALVNAGEPLVEINTPF
ncbi:MAG: DUF5615 family PIN-like protein [Pyrinomonadaceae bacterium]